MDTNVPPYQTMLIADALIKANKDFDLLMLPNQNHGYGTASAYMMRRRWDYFVKWLLGAGAAEGVPDAAAHRRPWRHTAPPMIHPVPDLHGFAVARPTVMPASSGGAVHSAVGCSVASKCTTRLRS